MVLKYLTKLIFGKKEPEEKYPQRGFNLNDTLLIDGIYNGSYKDPDLVHTLSGNACFFSTDQHYAIFNVNESQTGLVTVEHITRFAYRAKQENCIILDRPLTTVTPKLVASLFPIDILKNDIPCLWYVQGLEELVWETKSKNN